MSASAEVCSSTSITEVISQGIVFKAKVKAKDLQKSKAKGKKRQRSRPSTLWSRTGKRPKPMPFVLEAPEDQSQVLKDTSLDIWYPLNYPVQYVKDLKMIGKGFVLFQDK